MTLEQMKEKIYSLIEEYNENADDLTDDPDLAGKMNSVINQIQNELARFKKIPAYTELEVTKDEEITLNSVANDLYQLNVIRGVDYDTIADRVIFNEDGLAKIYYYKYPTQIDSETDDSFELELSTDLLEIMPYGVAADLLKSDVSNNYGEIYATRYKEMISQLDPRYGMGGISIENGVTI